MPAAKRWAQLLMESDRRHFAAGAVLHDLPGGTLAVTPGWSHFAVGAVGWIDDSRPVLADPWRWRRLAGDVWGSHAARLIRFYTSASAALGRALASAGFEPCVELAMMATPAGIAGSNGRENSPWSLRCVDTPSLWKAKQRVHDLTPERPDGKSIDAAAWVALERRKVDAGYMTAWLIECEGEPCGAFGLSQSAELLRFKNMFVVPGHRGRGCASAAMRLIAREASGRGVERIGCFALADSAGERLYRRMGFVTVGRQIEWTATVAACEERGAVGVHDVVE